MASNLHIAAAVRNAGVDSMISNAALNTGTIEIRNGTQPATPETTATGTLLAVLTLNSTAFGSASAGVATAGAIASGVGLAEGTPTWARIKTAGGTAKIDGSCGLAAGTPDVVIDAVPIAIGATVSCSALTFGIGA